MDGSFRETMTYEEFVASLRRLMPAPLRFPVVSYDNDPIGLIRVILVTAAIGPKLLALRERKKELMAKAMAGMMARQ